VALIDYKCVECEHTFEEIVNEPKDTIGCPKCKAEAKRLWNATPLAIFTVRGFYTTDYKGANSNSLSGRQYMPKIGE